MKADTKEEMDMVEREKKESKRGVGLQEILPAKFSEPGRQRISAASTFCCELFFFFHGKQMCMQGGASDKFYRMVP